MTDHLAEFEAVASPAEATVAHARDPEAREPRDVLAADVERARSTFDQARDLTFVNAAAEREARREAAAIEYAADPVDPNRTAALLEADQLSRGLTRLTARGVFDSGWEDLRHDRPDRAAIKLQAGRLAGGSDEPLAAAIEAARDKILPNRIRGLKMAEVASAEYAKVWVGVTAADARMQALLGRGPAAAEAMLKVKLAEGVAATAEGRPVRSDVALGLPPPAPTRQAVPSSGPAREVGRR